MQNWLTTKALGTGCTGVFPLWLLLNHKAFILTFQGHNFYFSFCSPSRLLPYVAIGKISLGFLITLPCSSLLHFPNTHANKHTHIHTYIHKPHFCKLQKLIWDRVHIPNIIKYIIVHNVSSSQFIGLNSVMVHINHKICTVNLRLCWWN